MQKRVSLTRPYNNSTQTNLDNFNSNGTNSYQGFHVLGSPESIAEVFVTGTKTSINFDAPGNFLGQQSLNIIPSQPSLLEITLNPPYTDDGLDSSFLVLP